STLQTFPPSAPQGKITSGSGPPRDADAEYAEFAVTEKATEYADLNPHLQLL
ncbi:hypothetical protein Tco_0267834, partial [Tanacetum coccineum]